MLPDIPGLGGAGALLVAFLIAFIIYLLIIGFVLWVAGEIIVGRRVTFGQALAIAGAGTFLVLGAVFLLGLIGLLLGFIIFLALVRHYFKTGWLGALGVTIMAVIVAVILTFVLGVLAIGLLFTLPSLPFIQPYF
ncbi:MAG TPA: hypothetical protein VIH34_01540 [Candidatus Bathyarchaeia archaeon]